MGAIEAMRTCRVSYFGDDEFAAVRIIFEVNNDVSGQEIYLIGLGLLFENNWIPNGDEIVEFDLDGLWIPILNPDKTVSVLEVVEEGHGFRLGYLPYHIHVDQEEARAFGLIGHRLDVEAVVGLEDRLAVFDGARHPDQCPQVGAELLRRQVVLRVAVVPAHGDDDDVWLVEADVPLEARD